MRKRFVLLSSLCCWLLTAGCDRLDGLRERFLGSSSGIRFTERDYVDVELRVPNVAKARNLLDFEAEVSLEDGIARTGEFYRRKMKNVS